MRMKRIIIGMAVLISSILIHAQKPVDVHTHIILPEYRELLQRHGAELEETFPLPDPIGMRKDTSPLWTVQG